MQLQQSSSQPAGQEMVEWLLRDYQPLTLLLQQETDTMGWDSNLRCICTA